MRNNPQRGKTAEQLRRQGSGEGNGAAPNPAHVTQGSVAPVLTMPAEGAARTRPVSVPRSQDIKQVTHNGLTWVNIVNPGGAEAEWMRRTYGFHPLHLEDTLSKRQLSKIDDTDDYTFIVMFFPVYSRLVRVTTASEVDIFVGENYVITAHADNLKPLHNLFVSCMEDPESRAKVMGQSSGYLLYQIVDRLVDYCFPILDKIGDNIEAAEDAIFEDRLRHTIQEISIVRRDIISFRRIIKRLIPVVNSLERKNRSVFREDMEEYFGDISDHLSKIWDTLEDFKEVIEGLSDTINWLMSSRVNDIIKVLTIISVILLPLTLISGIYGMNVPLPWGEHPNAFYLIIGVMVAVIAAMLAFFRWRKWI
jgi:magnesium transporter